MLFRSRVTARKDAYDEVTDWICNECRFEKKQSKDWVIEGPTKIDRSSVISQNHYVLKEPAHKPNLNAVDVVQESKQIGSR